MMSTFELWLVREPRQYSQECRDTGSLKAHSAQCLADSENVSTSAKFTAGWAYCRLPDEGLAAPIGYRVRQPFEQAFPIPRGKIHALCIATRNHRRRIARRLQQVARAD